jgi:aspartyl-tRNA(Asn)/glutamyl-tRNA(Gln) amidotransferase subunit A
VDDWRVAVAGPGCLEQSDPEVLAALRAAAGVFEELGASVRDVELTGLEEAAAVNGLVVVADGATFHHARLTANPDGFGADVLTRLRRGEACATRDYVEARRTQTVLRREWSAWFADFDVLLLPATPIAAPIRAGLDPVSSARVLTRFTAPFNLTGFPAISLPCGFTHDELPIGLQIAGPAWGEAHVLRAAHAFEQATPWHERRPPI